MALTLAIFDETVRGERMHTARVKLASEQCTVRQLLEQRVAQEVRRYNLERPVCARMLVRPHDADETAQGFRQRQHRDLDATRALAAALDAFTSQSLTVQVNGQLIKDLDQALTLSPSSEVVFVSLMSITGG